MDGQNKACMWCGEDIKAGARICRFCNREQSAPKAEEVLYEGPGRYPIGQLIVDLFLMTVLIGFLTLPLHYLDYRSRIYRITTKKVTFEGGFLSKRIEVMELYRVQDIRFTSEWGSGTITLVSSDRTTPRLFLPIPNARPVFDRLQGAIQDARKEAGVAIRETA